jgi:hypothetical protein
LETDSENDILEYNYNNLKGETKEPVSEYHYNITMGVTKDSVSGYNSDTSIPRKNNAANNIQTLNNALCNK